MLDVQEVSAYYGRIEALRRVNLEVAAGEIVALIGSNGAGKTTLLNVISGLHPLGGGRVEFDGRDLRRTDPVARVAVGIVQVPEGRQLFGPLTVKENLEMGAYLHLRGGPKAASRKLMDRVFEVFPVLGQRRNQAAGTLSGGEQQMLALGRGLMGQPKLLLLDEPSLGLAPMVVAEIFRIISTLREQGTTVLLVEQNAKAALKVADRAYVLETGRLALSGTAAELLDNEEVKRAFLGRRRAAKGAPPAGPGV
ncbi:MAG: ABC transporter ATP-binding protein [Proteobacteria bacterium]|nr:ABC transporter ATP-binding protein [Pseudomonadota bacterium]